MEKTVFTNLSPADFQALIINAVNACLRNHEQRHTANKPQRASRNHAQNDHSNNTQKQAAWK